MRKQIARKEEIREHVQIRKCKKLVISKRRRQRKYENM
jgi:hypothetical protein